jgi:sterol desaturase/sphingolipid hydroxylase (fatty acid hydroxylase superfamily)
MHVASVIQFVADNPNSTQFFLFGAVVVGLWLVEQAATAEPVRTKLRHTSINVLYMSAVLPIQIVMMMVCVAMAQWVTAHHWGLIYLLPDVQSPWIRLGVTFLMLDFLDYVYHFTAHQFKPLWRLHLLHHTDQAVDVSTTFRENPGETFVRTCFFLLWIFICGASVEVLVLRQTFETFANVSQHTVFRLPRRAARIAGWLFVTPNLHHAHHHCRLPGTNCNYGDVLSVWDRLFGTYFEMDGEETVFGLDSHMGPETDRLALRILSSIGSSGPVKSARRIYRTVLQSA